MQFRFCSAEALSIPGAFLIDYNVFKDNRGSFVKLATPELFSLTGGPTTIAQLNYSKNIDSGTWRGFHVQGEPHQESKILSCLSGSANDYLVDVRKSSATFGSMIKIKLSQNSGKAILIAPGIAHGYQTLEPNTEFLYVHNQHWAPDATHTLDFRNSQLHLDLELPVTEISSSDLEGFPLEYFKTLEW